VVVVIVKVDADGLDQEALNENQMKKVKNVVTDQGQDQPHLDHDQDLRIHLIQIENAVSIDIVNTLQKEAIKMKSGISTVTTISTVDITMMKMTGKNERKTKISIQKIKNLKLKKNQKKMKQIRIQHNSQ